MRVLIIGNGFDIEHQLPTQYKDFILFAECVLEKENEATEDVVAYKAFIEGLHENERNCLAERVKGNFWFNMIEEKKGRVGDKWIDFETEVYRIIKEIDTLCMKVEYDDQDSEFWSYIHANKQDMEATAVSLFEKYKAWKDFGDTLTFRKIKDVLLNDLNDFIFAIEFYLLHYVQKIHIDKYNEDILRILPNKVLSFNYTDTYERIYRPLQRDVECYHIHGSLSNNNTILGIDEYLEPEKRKNNVLFIGFQKYFQRLEKHTGNEQNKWLKQIAEEPGESEVFFFGHSFAKSDGDIISSFVDNDKIRTTILYHDESAYKDIIINLNAILGTEKMLSLVYGAEPRIVLKEQSKRLGINDGTYEIRRDLALIDKWPGMSYSDFTNLLNNVLSHVDGEDIEYFCEQDMVVLLAFILQREDLLNDDRLDRLIKLAKELPNNRRYFDLEQYCYYDDYRGQYWGKGIIRLIHMINENNMDNVDEIDKLLTIGMANDLSPEVYLEIIVKMIDLYKLNGDSWYKYREVAKSITTKHYNIAKAVLDKLGMEYHLCPEKYIIDDLLEECYYAEYFEGLEKN